MAHYIHSLRADRLKVMSLHHVEVLQYLKFAIEFTIIRQNCGFHEYLTHIKQRRSLRNVHRMEKCRAYFIIRCIDSSALKALALLTLYAARC